MSEKESFSFDKGINRRKKNTLLLEDGELYSASGFDYESDGTLETRQSKTASKAIASSINWIHRYGANIYAKAGTAIYRRTAEGAYSSIDTFSNTRPRHCDYESFTFLVGGGSKRAYIDAYPFEFGVDNPSTSPTVAVGAAGNPSGTYNCYVTFYITFTNDKVVETGPCTAASVTVASEKIEWSAIPTCSFSGTVTSIYRRLWRDVSGVVYLATTLSDNTTTTYSDDVTDATLQLSEPLGSTNYSTPPSSPVDITMHLQRIFLISGSTLYWSEPYKPFSFKTTSSGVVSKDNETLVGLVAWGDQLYIVSAEKWYRLNGSDPDTWAIKQTWSDSGVSNRNTIIPTKYGMLGLWYDGIYNYDGNTSKNLTEKKMGRQFFKDLTHSTCFAVFDGVKYYFYYNNTSCLVMDLTYTPDIRFYEDDFAAHAHEFYKPTGVHYFAKNGYEYVESGSETIATSFITGNKGFGNILKRKLLKYFYYDINTEGKDVTVSIYVDGTLGQTLTLNTSSRQRKRSDPLKNMEGYMFELRYSCSNSTGVEIYSPWGLEADPVGD